MKRKTCLALLVCLVLLLPVRVRAEERLFAQGALGFYQSAGSKEALSILQQGAEEGIVDVAGLQDSASLQSLYKGVDLIRQANRIRKKHGQEALRITDSLMAVCQVQTDISLRSQTHSLRYPVAENLAWLPQGQDDPFTGWYDQQRDWYDLTGDIGVAQDYFNLIKGTHELAGAAVAGANGWNCWGIVFAAADQERSYTPGEYLTRLNKYVRIALTGKESSPGIPVYALTEDKTGKVTYTRKASEVVKLASSGWSDVRLAWYAADKSQKPVYKLENPDGDVFYTMDEAEKAGLVKLGWKDAGIAWHTKKSGKPVWQLYNPETGYHRYTADRKEKQGLVKDGWTEEKTAWYAL